MVHPDALTLKTGGKQSGGDQMQTESHFAYSRFVSSSAWSSITGHHTPNLKRIISSATGVRDIEMQLGEQLKAMLSTNERGEPRISAASISIRYPVEVSLFLHSDHKIRIQAVNDAKSRSGQTLIEALLATGVNPASGEATIVKDLPWNLVQSLAICELLPLVSGPAGSSVQCSPSARALTKTLYALQETMAKSSSALADANTMEPILSAFDKSERLMERYYFSGSSNRQNFRPIVNDGAHFSTSTIGLGQQMCDGSRTGRDFDFEATKLQAVASRAIWNQHLLESYGAELATIMVDDITESTTSLRAEELLLKKVKIWDPFRYEASRALFPSGMDKVNLKEGHMDPTDVAALEVLFRPTLLCAVMTSFDGLKLSLMQYLLWGDQCDDFVVIVASTDSNGQTRLRNSFVDLQRLVRIRQERLVHVRMTTEDLKRNLWFQFQLSLIALDDWDILDMKYQYVYFATEDTFMVPENLYDMLMQPEWFTLHAANTPLLLGNVMFEPSERVYYAASGPGIVLNNVALRLAVSLTPTDTCNSKLVSNAWDVLLAKCLSTAGVIARDTVDELGEDRFHILSLHWMLLSPTLPAQEDGSEAWWYEQQRPRDVRNAMLRNPFRALSASSIAFNKVKTPERALWMHMQLRHNN